MDLVIRQAEERDIAPMADLDRVCFSVPWSETSFTHEIKENPVAFYLVAEIGGELAGYAGMWVVVDEGHITNVATHPDHRKKGIATAMLTLLIETSRNEGIFKHTLEVRESSRHVIDLYTKLGFVAAGVRKGYYSDNHEDAVIMWRTE